MDRYGVYINPCPGVKFTKSRLKSEAKTSGLAYWVIGRSERDVLNILIEESLDPKTIKDYYKNGDIYIELDIERNKK